MIDFVEIRSASLELIGLIDAANSIIWETQYFGAGRFEIYTEATAENVALLQCGNFVTRFDNEGVAIIEAVAIDANAQDGRMITASGRLAKSILDRRLISFVNGNTNPSTDFSGNVEHNARVLVRDNAIACYKDKGRTIAYPARNISILQLGASAGLEATTESRQVICENLLTYTDDFLRQYGYGAKLLLDGGKLNYTVYSGKDRSFGNAAGNEPVVFSEDFDNLIGSNYSFDESTGKTVAIVGGEGEGNARFYVECNATQSGLARREVFIDSSLKKEEYSNAQYILQLTEEGKQELAKLTHFENFAGSIDLTSSTFAYGADFGIGDIVTMQDNSIGKYINVRVITATEVQDDNGYQVNIEFEAV